MAPSSFQSARKRRNTYARPSGNGAQTDAQSAAPTANERPPGRAGSWIDDNEEPRRRRPACGSATSNPAVLTICPSDFNCDGLVNSQDFFDFLGAFFAGQPAADFNHDALVNSQDFFDFLAAFFSGC